MTDFRITLTKLPQHLKLSRIRTLHSIKRPTKIQVKFHLGLVEMKSKMIQGIQEKEQEDKTPFTPTNNRLQVLHGEQQKRLNMRRKKIQDIQENNKISSKGSTPTRNLIKMEDHWLVRELSHLSNIQVTHLVASHLDHFGDFLVE